MMKIFGIKLLAIFKQPKHKKEENALKVPSYLQQISPRILDTHLVILDVNSL
jgi:hypothetical protein